MQIPTNRSSIIFSFVPACIHAPRREEAVNALIYPLKMGFSFPAPCIDSHLQSLQCQGLGWDDAAGPSPSLTEEDTCLWLRWAKLRGGDSALPAPAWPDKSVFL